MRENIISVVIEKPVLEVFEFSTDPANTPKWVDSILQEEVIGHPVDIGSVYRNQNKEGVWSEVRVIAYEPNRLFVLQEAKYTVEYTYEDLGTAGTRLTYREWVDEGELESPFGQNVLDKLKVVMEKSLTHQS